MDRVLAHWLRREPDVRWVTAKPINSPSAITMLPLLEKRPDLRCQAHSRRSGWLQCGRLAAYGSRMCQSHGARKRPRFGIDAPNYIHGRRTAAAIQNDRHSNQRVRLLAIGLAGSEGVGKAAEAAGRVFDKAWPQLLQEQAEAELRLAQRLSAKPRRKAPLHTQRTQHGSEIPIAQLPSVLSRSSRKT